jgi:hypothetical protein
MSASHLDNFPLDKRHFEAVVSLGAVRLSGKRDGEMKKVYGRDGSNMLLPPPNLVSLLCWPSKLGEDEAMANVDTHIFLREAYRVMKGKMWLTNMTNDGGNKLSIWR